MTKIELIKDQIAYKQLAKKYLRWYHQQLFPVGLTRKYKRQLDKQLEADFKATRIRYARVGNPSSVR